eukprot:6124332-Prymnesium_polylepis.2
MRPELPEVAPRGMFWIPHAMRRSRTKLVAHRVAQVSGGGGFQLRGGSAQGRRGVDGRHGAPRPTRRTPARPRAVTSPWPHFFPANDRCAHRSTG